MTTSEEGSMLSRRSSSQTSHVSSDSKKAKPVAGRPQRSLSKSSNTPSHKPDPSLTSFPSFSPEQGRPPDASKKDSYPKPLRTISQKLRQRKATLAGLTSASPTSVHTNALFHDTSPRSSVDIPGALHLAGDDHINRLIARTGAVKLVRQFASDLAQRDVEMTALRTRADNRERELKRLLREADVPSAEIEKRLLRLEQNPNPANNADELDVSGGQTSSSNIHEMMEEAMQRDLTDSPPGLQTAAIQSDESGPKDSHSRQESLTELEPTSVISSRKTSRTSSIVSQGQSDADATLKPRVPSSKTGGFRTLEDIFQPPALSTSYFIGGANKSLKRQKPADTASIRSTQSSSSWTKLFGGKSQIRKEEAGRPRSSSVEQGAADDASRPASALASLSKMRTNPSTSISKSNTSLVSSEAMKARPTGRRTPNASRLSANPNHVRKESNASNDFPPTVEMDSMFESSLLPPTMTLNNYETEGVLTDRFGFIYDQRHRKRHSAAIMKNKKNRLSGAETLGSFRSDGSDEDTRSPGADGKFLNRPSTPASIDRDSKNSWHDFLKPVSSALTSQRPRELLLSHTPSANQVITIGTVKGTISPPSRTRSTSISVSTNAQKALPTLGVVSGPIPSPIMVTSTDTGGDTQQLDTDGAANDQEPVKLLLDQLNELHDSLQTEKTVKWNSFFRAVRADRIASSDRNINNAPEADLLNGELVGFATLGRKSKYHHFRSLVLGGIPVGLRGKIWAECTGAYSLRIPGYYDDLVNGSAEVDPEIAIQIKADVRRTMQDNIFFVNGPGAFRLEEVLRAYSLHNTSISYCQGMNLLAGSLLLVCATPEDCFWLLVAIVDHILPSGYFDQDLLVARADQLVLETYVAELLPELHVRLQQLDVDLGAATFHHFISLYAAVLSSEALYRVWDVILCLYSQEDTPANAGPGKLLSVDLPGLSQPPTRVPVHPQGNENVHDGTSSTFLFQLSLALLKLNEIQILALDSAASCYSYLNSSMTSQNVSIDALLKAAEACKGKVGREDLLERRARAVKQLRGC